MLKRFSLMTVVASLMTGCVATGEAYRSDVYTAHDLNQAQEVRPVQIVAILPARVYVERSRASRASAELAGVILGAVAGAALGNHGRFRNSNRVLGGVAGGIAGGALAGTANTGGSLVDGVQITFRYGDKLLQSTQVGRACEYKPGTAVMVSPAPNITRIQPNNPGACPQPAVSD